MSNTDDRAENSERIPVRKVRASQGKGAG